MYSCKRGSNHGNNCGIILISREIITHIFIATSWPLHHRIIVGSMNKILHEEHCQEMCTYLTAQSSGVLPMMSVHSLLQFCSPTRYCTSCKCPYLQGRRNATSQSCKVYWACIWNVVYKPSILWTMNRTDAHMQCPWYLEASTKQKSITNVHQCASILPWW